MNSFKWHPMKNPVNSQLIFPPRYGKYLVTVYVDNEYRTDCCFLLPKYDEVLNKDVPFWERFSIDKVIAWMEMPEPYGRD